MSKTAVIFLIATFYVLVTPGFQCGNSPIECRSNKTDTALLPFVVLNPSAVYHVNDTIRLESIISDTIHANSGKTFITEINSLTTTIQPYKVIGTGSSAYLNYATNEFNAIVETGSFVNIGSAGFQIHYNRTQPLNTMKAALVAGDTGLFLVTVNLNQYSSTYELYLYDPSDRCINYNGISNIVTAQQQTQFWNLIGTTTLALANNFNNYVVQANRNYFFINVVP